jgi:hypothetical protein
MHMLPCTLFFAAVMFWPPVLTITTGSCKVSREDAPSFASTAGCSSAWQQAGEADSVVLSAGDSINTIKDVALLTVTVAQWHLLQGGLTQQGAARVEYVKHNVLNTELSSDYWML